MTAHAPEPPRDEAVFRCHDVTRVYGNGRGAVVAVHDVACTVAPRARIALTGPSGSGKSTLLHLMAGLDQPTHGTVSWPGLGGSPTQNRELVGVVFQNPSLLEPLDVRENIEFPLRVHGMNRDLARRRSEQALSALGLQDLGPRLPEELSGGQAQRVAAARVLAGCPRLILADEPTGQLDHETGDRVVTALLTAADRLGAALVVATHDRAVADRLAQRWPMSHGQLTIPTGEDDA
ncbi:ABC transporter ATP-binding protein [Krasilnikovia sp. MM14-A1004]|uniref:ABC transporter ATP-binding protein n=1 Tax=Krasilnikovia sp. MM14-A1004 TaxID=3373541 RepID=UPI00399CE5DD